MATGIETKDGPHSESAGRLPVFESDASGVRVRRVWGSSQTRLGFDSDAGNAGSEEPLSGGRFRCAAAIEVRRDAAVPESEPTAE